VLAYQHAQVDSAVATDFQLIHAVDRDGHTAALAAAATNQAAVIRVLAERGANLNVQDYEGMTALHVAVETSSLAAGVELLRLGADPNVTTTGRKTPLDLVAALSDKQRAALRILTTELLRMGGKGAVWSELVSAVGVVRAIGGSTASQVTAADLSGISPAGPGEEGEGAASAEGTSGVARAEGRGKVAFASH
jgi:hypothetical protein